LQRKKFTLSLFAKWKFLRDVLREYNSYMRQKGLPEEKRVHCHGQGYDVVESPIASPDETLCVAPNMNLGIHPLVGKYFVLTDNFFDPRRCVASPPAPDGTKHH